MVNQRIIILGGYGTYGSLIAEQLAQSNVQVVIAGRDSVKGQKCADSLQADFVRCDASDPASLRDALSGAHLLINASGPFQAKDYSIPQACIQQQCHYIDLADGRAYVAGISQLDEEAKAHGVFICVGASTTPAVTSAVIAELRPHSRHIRSIKIALNAGNRNQAGVSTIASILAYVGLPLQVWRENRWRELMGWGEGEFVDFPQPVGRRRVQLCDVPDLQLFPKLFAAESVIFKAGVELTLFNYALATLAQVRKGWPSLNMPRLAKSLVLLSKCFKGFGTYHGSLAVWVTGEDEQERSLALVAPRNGPRIPSAPAVLLTRKLLAEGIPACGAFPCVGFICLADFAEFLARFGVFTVRGQNGMWISR